MSAHPDIVLRQPTPTKETDMANYNTEAYEQQDLERPERRLANLRGPALGCRP